MTEPSLISLPTGVALAVYRWPGEGVPFLLVHGLASNARLWEGVAEVLAAAGHAVASVDLRGHGRSDKPDDGYDFATVTDDLVALIEVLGFDRPVVAGQSWGGNVVIELAARHPDLVRGVACVDGGWIAFSQFGTWDELAARLAPPKSEGTPSAAIEAMLRKRHPDWPEGGIEGALACFEHRADGTVKPWLSLERHLMILRSMWEERIDEVHHAVHIPVLLMPCDDGSAWGARKRGEVESAEANLAKSRTHWFKADHDVHAQYPEAVADVLLGAVADGFYS